MGGGRRPVDRRAKLSAISDQRCAFEPRNSRSCIDLIAFAFAWLVPLPGDVVMANVRTAWAAASDI